MTKSAAYITMESFGSELPENWESAAAHMNALIEQLPEDEFGMIDRDDVDAIWSAYCAGEYDAEIEA